MPSVNNVETDIREGIEKRIKWAYKAIEYKKEKNLQVNVFKLDIIDLIPYLI